MLSKDPFMKRCIWDNENCDGRVEFEHAFLFAGIQIVLWWAIVPVCTYHHRGKGLVKNFNQAVAFGRAYQDLLRAKLVFSIDQFVETLRELYPRHTWPIKYLLTKYKKQLKALDLL